MASTMFILAANRAGVNEEMMTTQTMSPHVPATNTGFENNIICKGTFSVFPGGVQLNPE